MGNWLQKAAIALPAGYFNGIGAALDTLRGDFAEAAQKVYDEWEQDDEGFDEELGTGGICDRIASALAEVVYSQLSPRMGFREVEVVDAGPEGHHAFITVVNPEAKNAAVVDIPPAVYETGAGDAWRKIPGVAMAAGDISIEEIPYEDVGETVEERGDEVLAKTAQWGDRPPALPSGDLGDAQRSDSRREKPRPSTLESQWQQTLRRLDLFLTGKKKERYMGPEELLEDSEGAIYLSDGGYSRIIARFEGWDDDKPEIGISGVSRPQVKERWHSVEAAPLKARLLELMQEFVDGEE